MNVHRLFLGLAMVITGFSYYADGWMKVAYAAPACFLMFLCVICYSAVLIGDFRRWYKRRVLFNEMLQMNQSELIRAMQELGVISNKENQVSRFEFNVLKKAPGEYVGKFFEVWVTYRYGDSIPNEHIIKLACSLCDSAKESRILVILSGMNSYRLADEIFDEIRRSERNLEERGRRADRRGERQDLQCKINDGLRAMGVSTPGWYFDNKEEDLSPDELLLLGDIELQPHESDPDYVEDSKVEPVELSDDEDYSATGDAADVDSEPVETTEGGDS